MKFVSVLLALAVVSASAKVIVKNINDDIDASIEAYNKRGGSSIYPLKEGNFTQLYHSEGFLIWDSIERTSDATYTLDDENLIYSVEYSFGAKLLVATFSQMEFLDENATAAFRLRNNSVHLKFSVSTDKDTGSCNFTLDDLSFERLDDLEFSSPKFVFDDDVEIDIFFESYVYPGIKSYLKNDFAANLQKDMSQNPGAYCYEPYQPHSSENHLGNILNFFFRA